ncbi:cupin domain-containing protein [Staphylococcus shinii]
MVIIEPGGTVNGEPRGSSANEYITVFDGTLTLVLGDERVVVKKDESIKFNGNLFHKYLNEHDSTLRLNMIIHY